jgi:hypothetical protein
MVRTGNGGSSPGSNCLHREKKPAQYKVLVYFPTDGIVLYCIRGFPMMCVEVRKSRALFMRDKRRSQEPENVLSQPSLIISSSAAHCIILYCVFHTSSYANYPFFYAKKGYLGLEQSQITLNKTCDHSYHQDTLF